MVLLLPRGRSPGGYRFRDLYNPLGQDVIVCKAASPQVDDMHPVIGHPSLKAHLGADLNFSVAFQTTQVPVIFGIHVTKRRESPNDTFTPGGPGRKHEGWASALEAALSHPHTGAAIRNGDRHLSAHHQPPGNSGKHPPARGCKREHANIGLVWSYTPSHKE